MKLWKRSLLRAWLALSLLWAAGFTIYIVILSMDLLGGAQVSAIYIGVSLLYVLPMGIMPPLLLFAIGSLIVWIIDRSPRANARN